jgi:hypothetical protein
MKIKSNAVIANDNKSHSRVTDINFQEKILYFSFI